MKRLLLFALFAAVAGCSSPGGSNNDRTLPKALVDRSEVHGGSEFKLPGERVYAEMQFYDKQQRLALVNSGSTKPADVYSKYAVAGTALKVAKDTMMADMYEALRRLEFNKYTQPSKPTGASWSLMLDVDGVKQTVYYDSRKLDVNSAQMLQAMQSIFLTGFNRTTGLQTVDPNKGGKTLFLSEEQRIRQENAKTGSKK